MVLLIFLFRAYVSIVLCVNRVALFVCVCCVRSLLFVCLFFVWCCDVDSFFFLMVLFLLSRAVLLIFVTLFQKNTNLQLRNMFV